MKTKRFQECKVDAISIEKIVQECPNKKCECYKSLNFTSDLRGRLKK